MHHYCKIVDAFCNLFNRVQEGTGFLTFALKIHSVDIKFAALSMCTSKKIYYFKREEAAWPLKFSNCNFSDL